MNQLEGAVAPSRSSARSLYRRARLNHWLQRKAAAASLCYRALSFYDYTKAYHLLAELELPGPDYLSVLGNIHRALKPATYLETGVSEGASLRLVSPETDAIGIDPAPKVKHLSSSRHRVFAETSDDFFANHDVIAELGGKRIRMAFIDGMHLFEYALRDFANIEARSDPDSVVLVHDCYPLDVKTSARERTTTFWSGDVWRLMLLLKKHRPDLRLHTIGATPTGLGIISRLNPQSRLIKDNLAELIAEGLAIDFNTVAAVKAEAFNLIPNQWEQVRLLLPGRG